MTTVESRQGWHVWDEACSNKMLKQDMKKYGTTEKRTIRLGILYGFIGKLVQNEDSEKRHRIKTGSEGSD